MKILLTLWIALAACNSTSDICQGDHCQCALDEPCQHNCTAGGVGCDVQCVTGQPCDVGCAAGKECHVECSTSSSCDVDCGASPECHVTCPASGCTVHNCTGTGCVVSCGLSALPSHNGATATCP